MARADTLFSIAQRLTVRRLLAFSPSAFRSEALTKTTGPPRGLFTIGGLALGPEEELALPNAGLGAMGMGEEAVAADMIAGMKTLVSPQ